ncbi:MAG: PDZ domain-containing protein, partial [bacterium]|nr:PDZ domain-containing protein [bacterium]
SRSGGNQGVGFAVPINMGHDVLSQILENGEVRRGYLGVNIQNLTPAMAKAFDTPAVGGAVVNNVSGDSPAGEAGVERGDIITGVNGTPVEDARDLRLQVASIAPGTEVRLNVLRGGNPLELPITLGRYPETEKQASAPADSGTSSYGLTLMELTPRAMRQLRLPPGTEGIVVQEVRPGSAAAEAGLRPGDIIQEAARRPVTSLDDFRQAIRAANSDPMLLLVNRAGSTLYLVLEPR